MVSKCRCSVSPHYCDYCGVLSVMSPPRPQCPLHTPHLYHGWWRQEAGRWYFYVNNGWLGLGRLATLQWAIICQAETKLQTDDLMDLLAPPRHTDGPSPEWAPSHHAGARPRRGPRRWTRKGQREGQGEGQGEDASNCFFHIIVSQFPAPGRRRLSWSWRREWEPLTSCKNNSVGRQKYLKMWQQLLTTMEKF